MKAEQMVEELLDQLDHLDMMRAVRIASEIKIARENSTEARKQVEALYREVRFYEYLQTPCSKYEVRDTSL
jgi:DNA repair exonuclease SbcCD ATPase subunit